MENLSNILDYKILLASKSPRRLELIKQMGFEVETCPIDVDEDYPLDLDYRIIPEYLAEKKAKGFDYSLLNDNEILLTADTMVFIDGHSISKPENRNQAIDFLTSLSENKHLVITGVCLKTNKKEISFSASTTVYFKKLELWEKEYYVDNYKPYDKAGGYAIQQWIGCIGIEKIEGSYYNVVGLPTFEVFNHIKKIIVNYE
ncbi:MAG: Maf family nucleotide pyrophosphatase [Bacteroidales bacterium]|jgi:septum formation protein|nr:Maf family protein [Bacteroidales bacterium]MDD4544857.1 Maf family protein [Bacteroidales bacterium]MDY0054000.1 Maf family protein [Bacteroidales bacterium]